MFRSVSINSLLSDSKVDMYENAHYPANEKERLLALREYNVLDSLPDVEYDEITKIASEICQTPIALISLVDENRQWFKSKRGLEASETSRDHSFCGHAINSSDQLFEVRDSREDPRFADNPLVTGDPYVVFYAGIPLVTPDGAAIGTLCVIDNKPNQISQEARETLAILAKQVINKLELQKQNSELLRLNKQLREEIGKRKQKERELVVARDKALQAERAKDIFLSNMSHEIRTPMNGIIGITQLMLEEEGLIDGYKELVHRLDFSANHLLRIINDLLDLSKIKEGKLVFEELDFDLSRFLKNTHRILTMVAEKKELELVLQHDPAIPRWVRGDSHRLGQILLNLVGNAIKFTEEGSVRIETRLLFTDESKSLIQFRVCDTGIGIPSDRLPYIFDPFTQSDNSITRRFGGTGLGLSISKRLVEQFGGSIRVESTEGVGSKFIFAIELTHGEEQEVEFEEKLDLEIGFDKERLDILLVEDNDINQFVAVKHLEMMGFNVHTVGNGLEALAALEKKPYDLVLMDINMPVMNGIEASQKIRNSGSEYRDIKIIAMTASILKEDTERYVEAGMNSYVSKPFKPQELYQAITELVGE